MMGCSRLNAYCRVDRVHFDKTCERIKVRVKVSVRLRVGVRGPVRESASFCTSHAMAARLKLGLGLGLGLGTPWLLT